MSAVTVSTPKRGGQPTTTVSGILIRLAGLGVFNILAVWFMFNLLQDGFWALTLVFGAITILVNVSFLREGMYPIRWMVVGLSFMILLSIYPIIYTFVVAFTNFGDGHLLTKTQVITELEEQLYLPEGGEAYNWTAFQAADGSITLWLQSDGEPGLLARPGEALVAASPGEAGLGELDDDGIPVSLEGYERLRRGQLLALINDLTQIEFGVAPETVMIRNLDEAGAMQRQYIYDSTQDIVTDQETGIVYTPIDGTFTSADGDELRPGFQSGVGLENFQRFFTSSTIRGPLLRIVIWNFAFAFLSVSTTFFLGLLIALLFNDMPGKKLIRSLLIIPYTIPSLITILVWRGLLNTDFGVINSMIEAVFNTVPPWFTDATWAKIGILLINLWLGYPYFFLVCSGALQAIPTDIYEAAEVDGANAWQQFARLTLPLLLVAVGPLLVASFTFNFNNFNVIFLYNSGGPPIAGTTTPAGHTDILVSYVYRLAFAGGRGADYGLASAITIIIFVIVAIITLFQFRYTQMWEQVGENV